MVPRPVSAVAALTLVREAELHWTGVVFAMVPAGALRRVLEAEPTHVSKDKPKPKPDLEHLAWAIDQRAEVQRTLLALYSFVRENSPSWINDNGYVLNYLIGAAFSLWRAVFLADTFRDIYTIHKSQENFLEKLITDNAIAFADDKANRDWTVGYYLENAKLRLSHAAQYIDNHKAAFYQKDKKDLGPQVLPFLRMTGTMGVDLTRYEWESAHYALRLIFHVLAPKARIKANLPNVPQPKPLSKPSRNLSRSPSSAHAKNP